MRPRLGGTKKGDEMNLRELTGSDTGIIIYDPDYIETENWSAEESCWRFDESGQMEIREMEISEIDEGVVAGILAEAKKADEGVAAPEIESLWFIKNDAGQHYIAVTIKGWT